MPKEAIRFVIRRVADGKYLRKRRWQRIWVDTRNEADVWRSVAKRNAYQKDPAYEVIYVDLVSW